MVKRAVFVGRFQPFHNGHLKAVKDILEKIDEIVMVIGSSQYSHRLDNPFTTGERITMIRQTMDAEGVSPSKYWLVPVPDMHIHMIWVAQVVGYTPRFDVVYTNEPVTRRLFVEAGYKVEPVPFHKREVYSASEIRKRMLNDEHWEELVPNSVVEFIKKINGVERVQDLSKTDKIQ
ncbi:MAG: nicotinamide-nucleotide adenylyltransferase [Candidatus Bathyarchaeia archaeon]